MNLVDSHCHLDAAEFDGDRLQVIARARAVGVQRQIVPAIEAAEWPILKQVCAGASGLFPAYGLHPTFLPSHRPQHIEQLRGWIERERPTAIGECGLDYFIEGLDREQQAFYFEQQLRLAREFELPLIVHSRRAVDAVLASLRRFAPLTGVAHSFSGSQQQARQLAEQGFLIGLGGPVTYERARRLRAVAATAPIETLLLETDAPDQPDACSRGQRNEPAHLVRVLETIASLRGITPEDLATATTVNAERLFRLPALPADGPSSLG